MANVFSEANFEDEVLKSDMVRALPHDRPDY